MADGVPPGMSIETATEEDHVPVSRVLDGALLEHPDLRERIATGTVLVARRDGAVVGAVVVDASGSADPSPPAEWQASAHVEAIAVRRKRRRSGIGSALLQTASRRWGPLTATFDERVLSFYESLGAECRQAGDDDRWWAFLRERAAGGDDER
ncbi:GNAT family N-acetyltransferase [Salinarchaeum laminariae]|uniref:GNAT family N-acetyltransferase n=1 Tax=Salinarchaeum laminariae TaxID=869888 RepID=UPI0020BE61DC|nr:GNAT family N-acetyltransferase [Salinarchaeum laminariae]